MARFICLFIKRDGTVCGNICYDPRGCYRHWKLYEKNMKKKPCLNCGFPADTGTGYCAKFCSKYSAKFHSHNYRMRQKYKAETEALQPAKTSELLDETLQPAQARIPEAPISESDDSSASIHEHLFPASSQLFADSLRRDLTDSIWIEILGNRVVINGSATKSPRIYEDPVFESDDEDMGLGLFGD
ncbi:hypothetical protein RhiirC2_710192 [Rhizophagus irregularis]|uniref:Uncharacterized protein n=1 Tax=Rhizophagus irregularis TaxID=588596 RepID=A0A2N1NFT5_9GLOM|nr:hypothetical protein RhiirC2_710192 [Rhizophagus irregularis]